MIRHTKEIIFSDEDDVLFAYFPVLIAPAVASGGRRRSDIVDGAPPWVFQVDLLLGVGCFKILRDAEVWIVIEAGDVGDDREFASYLGELRCDNTNIGAVAEGSDDIEQAREPLLCFDVPLGAADAADLLLFELVFDHYIPAVKLIFVQSKPVCAVF